MDFLLLTLDLVWILQEVQELMESQEEAEVVEFVVPLENNKTLFVWNLESSLSEEVLHQQLFRTFSSFGPLYLLKLCDGSSTAGSTSALVKFFSSSHASRAQRLTDGRSLFQQRPLKVCLSSKETPHFLSRRTPLSHAHCLRLANRCLGFNGWSSDIITLKELEPEPDPDSGGRSLRLGCLLQLHFPFHRLTTRGSAVLQDTLGCDDDDPVQIGLSRARLVKAVRDRALVQAFSNVLLVLLGPKVFVHLRAAPECVDGEEAESGLKVTELTLPPDEEHDEDAALTLP